VIDVPGFIATHGAIDNGMPVHIEKENVWMSVLIVIITLIRLFWRDAFSHVLNDAPAAADEASGKQAAPMDGRHANLVGLARHAGTFHLVCHTYTLQL
jgi:hypothetical protein